MWVWVLGLGFKVLVIRHVFSMQERGPSLRVLVITCKVQMWHTHGVGETSRPSKRERINHIVQSISGLVELLNIQELLHYNWKFCIPPNVMWLCFMFCICSIRTQDFVVKIQLWRGIEVRNTVAHCHAAPCGCYIVQSIKKYRSSAQHSGSLTLVLQIH